MYRGVRSHTVDVQALQQQLNISHYISNDISKNDNDTLQLVPKQSSRQLNENKSSNKQSAKATKKQKDQLKQDSVDSNSKQVRQSIRNLLKFVESNKDMESKKQEDQSLNEYIKNVIQIHNDKYKYYANDINNSHNYINYSQKKKLPQPQYQGLVSNKGSEIEYMPYQPQITSSYWAGISKKSTGKNNTAISPYIFNQYSQKIDQEQPQLLNTSRLSSSRSTSRRNSLARTESNKNGQTIDSEINPLFDIQSTMFLARDQSKVLKKSNDDSVKKSLTQRNSVGGESKIIQQPNKRASLHSAKKEKRVQSARVYYKADQPSNEQNSSQVSINHNKMYYSSLFQDNSINAESKDFIHSKDSHFPFHKPNQLDLNNAVSMPAEDEIFTSRSNFMRGNTLKNNWMNRLQQQIKDKRVKAAAKQSYKKQNNSNYLIIEVQQPTTPQKSNPFCLTNEYIKKQTDFPFSMINSFFVEGNGSRQNSKKPIQSSAAEKRLKSNKNAKPTDENRLSIASIAFQDHTKDGEKTISSKSKQTTPFSNQGSKKNEVRTPLNFANWRK